MKACKRRVRMESECGGCVHTLRRHAVDYSTRYAAPRPFAVCICNKPHETRIRLLSHHGHPAVIVIVQPPEVYKHALRRLWPQEAL